MCVCVWVWAHVHRAAPSEVRRGGQIPRENVSCLIWVLGTEVGFSVEQYWLLIAGPSLYPKDYFFYVESKVWVLSYPAAEAAEESGW